MRAPLKYLAAALMPCLCTLLTDHAISQATPSPTASQAPTNGSSARHKPKEILVPYHGVISAVDKNAKTFTIEGRMESDVLKIIDGTLITKDGQTVTIDNLNKNDEVSGSHLKDADGTLLARTVKIGLVKHKAIPTPTASPGR